MVKYSPKIKGCVEELADLEYTYGLLYAKKRDKDSAALEMSIALELYKQIGSEKYKEVNESLLEIILSDENRTEIKEKGKESASEIIQEITYEFSNTREFEEVE